MNSSDILQINTLGLAYASGFHFQCQTPIRISKGDKLCLMGRNGAGKSTFLKLLSADIEAQSGSIQFSGQKVHPANFEYKQRIGYLPQEPSLPKWTNAKDLIRYLNDLRGTATNLGEHDIWGIGEYAHKALALCSYGMQKRVSLHLALSHNPSLVLLDEPFSGLDINHAATLESWIQKAKDSIIILSTHSSYTAAKLCNRCLLLKSGDLSEVQGWSELNLEERMSLLESEVKAA
jgi:ABC-2 type transport system ATP-binding protein